MLAGDVDRVVRIRVDELEARVPAKERDQWGVGRADHEPRSRQLGIRTPTGPTQPGIRVTQHPPFAMQVGPTVDRNGEPGNPPEEIAPRIVLVEEGSAIT